MVAAGDRRRRDPAAAGDRHPDPRRRRRTRAHAAEDHVLRAEAADRPRLPQPRRLAHVARTTPPGWAAPSVVLALRLLAGCGGSDDGDASGTKHIVQWDGLTRTYTVQAKPHPARDAPIFMILHLRQRQAAELPGFADLPAAAARRGFVVVTPMGIGYSWNAGACCDPAVARKIDDVGFLRRVIADVRHQYGNARRPVVVAGFSNGGFMAYRLSGFSRTRARRWPADATRELVTGCYSGTRSVRSAGLVSPIVRRGGRAGHRLRARRPEPTVHAVGEGGPMVGRQPFDATLLNSPVGAGPLSPSCVRELRRWTGGAPVNDVLSGVPTIARPVSRARSRCGMTPRVAHRSCPGALSVHGGIWSRLRIARTRLAGRDAPAASPYQPAPDGYTQTPSLPAHESRRLAFVQSAVTHDDSRRLRHVAVGRIGGTGPQPAPPCRRYPDHCPAARWPSRVDDRQVGLRDRQPHAARCSDGWSSARRHQAVPARRRTRRLALVVAGRTGPCHAIAPAASSADRRRAHGAASHQPS